MQCYKKEIERVSMIAVDHEGMRVNMTLCRETKGSVYHCHYYEVKFSEGKHVIYLVNHGNVGKAWDEADRLRKYLITGRCH